MAAFAVGGGTHRKLAARNPDHAVRRFAGRRILVRNCWGKLRRVAKCGASRQNRYDREPQKEFHEYFDCFTVMFSLQFSNANTRFQSSFDDNWGLRVQ